MVAFRLCLLTNYFSYNESRLTHLTGGYRLTLLGPGDGGGRVSYSRAAKDNSVANQRMCTGWRREDEARESVKHWRRDGWRV